MIIKNLLPIFLSFAVFELSAQIQISESSTDRYAFSWNLENYDIAAQNSEEHSEIFFPGANTVLGEDGEAVIPGYSMLLGVPPEGEIRVSFNSEMVKTVSLEKTLLKHKNLIEKRQPHIKFRNPWICEPVYSTLQGMRTAHLIIRPFIYDEKSNTLKVLQKASCTIEFPSNPVSRNYSASSSNRKPILSNLVDNFPVADRWYAERKLSKVAQNTFPLTPGQKTYSFRIGDGIFKYNEMTTEENGILLIPGDTIIRNFGRQKIDAVVLYASHKGELPNGTLELADIPTGLVEVPLMRIDKNRNTFVDSDDYFLAFVTGASDWTFESSGKYSFRLDRYDDYRKYWLMISSGGAATVNSMLKTTLLADTISTVDNRIMFSDSDGTQQLSDNEGGLSWRWYEKIISSTSFNFLMPLPGLDTSQGGFISIIPESSSLQVFLGKPLVKETEGYAVEKWGNLTLSISTNSVTDIIELQNIKVNYKRRLIIGDSGKLEFFSPADSMFYTYKLQVATNDLLYIFRISNDEKEVSLVDTIRNFANRFFTWTDTGGTGIRYMVCSEKALTSLPQRSATAEKIKSEFLVENPRATSDSTDYLIISAPEFISAAQRLAAHKKNIGFRAPRIVNVKDVYDAFSGGDVDPVSIRNFIAYVQNYWKNSQHLSYVLLFGGGHYDYKGRVTKNPLFIPVYYDGFNVKEDYFTFYNGTSQAIVGRISCNEKDEATNVVDKIIAMEVPEKADYSDWRNRALFVADDDRQGSNPDGIGHHLSSDLSASTIEINNPSINIGKVYLYDYKWNSAGMKPEASKAIINEINNGVGYVNYFGHGGADQWAQEKVLMNDDVNKFINKDRYPLISSFSCSVGRFDMPNADCLSSLLLTGKYGAIATIASTRTAYAFSNEKLALSFYSMLFNPDTVNSLGMAFYKAKISSSSSYSSAYAILGDPSIVIMEPTNSLKMEITDKAGKKIDTLMALQQVTVTGSVVDKNGRIASGYGSTGPAFIHLGLFNSPEETGRNDGGENLSIRYKKPGRTVFMGRTQIRDGKFQQTIQLPGNLSFNKEGVKLTGYAWREGKIGASTGFKNNIIFSGTDTTMNANDSVGPQITMRPVHDHPEMSTEKMSFNDHVMVMDSLKCDIDVYDPSGVDVIGNGPDEGLNMEIEGVLGQHNINHKFRFNQGDYRNGTALLREYALKPGDYTINLSARDLNGNLSKASFKVKITQPQEFELDRVFNAPNPFRMGRGTKFFFFPTQTSYKTFAAIKIYTLSGKPIRVIKNAVNGQFWDGRDQAGTLLSPDIYLYQIVGSAPDQKKQVKSKIMKLVINP